MLNPLDTTADIAADHRRALLAEAAAERLARSAAPARPRRHARRGLLRWFVGRAVGSPARKIDVCGT